MDQRVPEQTPGRRQVRGRWRLPVAGHRPYGVQPAEPPGPYRLPGPGAARVEAPLEPHLQTVPADSTSAIAWSVPGRSSAIGFSQNTGSPDRAARPISSAWAGSPS
ncbi:hypothetical protein [Streptomyces fumanus]|uniref:hypothetical protein n=1 Tax=Streptomyces fumanus TaxID=67302 RepID=UPI0033EE55C3